MTVPAPGYGDLPATSDELGFTPSAVALAQIVQGAQLTDTPLTIGVYGAWGSGKTSLMRMILDRLDPNQCAWTWFDAWRYAQQEALWRALLLSVVESLRTLGQDDTWLHLYVDQHKRRTVQPQHPNSSVAGLG